MSTSRSCWKRRERQAAALFGSARTPLSGGNSKITRSDSLHGDLFIETKLRVNSAVHNLYDHTAELARAEGKVPVLCLAVKGRPGFLLVIRHEDVHVVHHAMKDVDTLPEVTE